MQDIAGIFEDTQDKIEAAEKKNTALEDKEISAAYSPMVIRFQERAWGEEESRERRQEEEDEAKQGYADSQGAQEHSDKPTPKKTSNGTNCAANSIKETEQGNNKQSDSTMNEIGNTTREEEEENDKDNYPSRKRITGTDIEEMTQETDEVIQQEWDKEEDKTEEALDRSGSLQTQGQEDTEESRQKEGGISAIRLAHNNTNVKRIPRIGTQRKNDH